MTGHSIPGNSLSLSSIPQFCGGSSQIHLSSTQEREWNKCLVCRLANNVEAFDRAISQYPAAIFATGEYRYIMSHLSSANRRRWHQPCKLRDDAYKQIWTSLMKRCAFDRINLPPATKACRQEVWSLLYCVTLWKSLTFFKSCQLPKPIVLSRRRRCLRFHQGRKCWSYFDYC